MNLSPHAGVLTIDDWIRGALDAPKNNEPNPQRLIGALELAPFQARAATRLVEIIENWSGALLADAVGMGKTRIAIACAFLLRRQRPRPAGPLVIVSPARVRTHWERHLKRANYPDDVRWFSHTSLSRSASMPADAHLIIVDEAHRFRNPYAQRTQTLRLATSTAPVLLVSATPIARSLNDLEQLLALFVSDRDLRSILGLGLHDAFQQPHADHFDLTELLQHVCVRRDASVAANLGGRPSTRLELLEYCPEPAEAWLWTELEPSLSRLDGGLLNLDWPRGLMTEHLLRRWESGAEALQATLQDLIEFHERWLEARACGRDLARADFRRLFGAAPRQNVLGFMYDASQPEDAPLSAEAVSRDLTLLREIEDRCREAVETPGGLERVVAELAADGQQILIFTSFRSAAHGLYDRLSSRLGPDARIGLVTGAGAWATGLGKTTAADLLERFSPRARGLDLPEHQSLQLLVATDCIAEGVDLQDCGRIVLADLPYTPLAIEQRIGRLVRPGNPHACVEVFLPRPRNWNDSLGMRRRLQARLEDASSSGLDYATLRETPLAQHADRTPFRALAALDALHASTERGHGVRGSFSTSATPDSALAHVRIRAGDATHETFVCVCEKRISWSTLDALNLLQEVRARAPQMVAATPTPNIRARLDDALERRRQRLRSALLAPAYLPMNSPQTRAWAKIREHHRSPEVLDDLRERLLCAMPAGRILRLSKLLDAEDAFALTRFVRELPKASASTNVELVVLSYVEVSKK